MEKLSELITDYRKNNAMTQNELATFLGVTTVTISQIENNKIRIGSRVLKKIAEKLQCDILEVVRLNENNKQV